MLEKSKIIASAPGKLILFGEHSVVLGKTALATAVSLRCYTQIIPASASVTLEFKGAMFTGKSSQFEWPLTELHYPGELPSLQDPSKRTVEFSEFIASAAEKKKSDFSNSIQSFLFLFLTFGRNPKEGIHVTIQSQLPMGGGLGSSAAFNTSLSLALLSYFNPSPDAPHDLSLIQKLSYECERFMHGNPSGIDNAVATYGGVIGFKSGALQTIGEVPPLNILIIDTNISRNTKLLVTNVGIRAKHLPEIMGPTLDAMDAISVQVLKLLKEHKESVELESELKTLVSINHHLLGAIGVGHEALDKIYHTTKKFGMNSKLTGAGGGGCAFALIEKATSEEAISNLSKELESMGYSSFRVQIGLPGAQLHKELPSESNWNFNNKRKLNYRTYNSLVMHHTTSGEKASEEVAKTLISLTEDLLVSVANSDWSTYEKLCDPSLTCFEPEARGALVRGLPFHLFYYQRTKPESQNTICQPDVRLLGSDVAVVSYVRLVQIQLPSGEFSTRRSEETRVWHKTDSWRCVHFHRSDNGQF